MGVQVYVHRDVDCLLLGLIVIELLAACLNNVITHDYLFICTRISQHTFSSHFSYTFYI